MFVEGQGFLHVFWMPTGLIRWLIESFPRTPNYSVLIGLASAATII